MKTQTHLIIGLALFFSFSLLMHSKVYSQKSDALEYMENIDGQFKSITVDTWDYVSAASHGKSASKVENRRKDLLKTISAAIKTISKLPDFEGDASFRDTVISFLNLRYNVLNKDFAKIVDMEEIAEQSYDLMEAYLLAQERADEKLEAADDNLVAEQKVFAGLHGITLLENNDKISKKLESSGKVYKYYNVIYLIFFKSNKQESYLMEAITKGDINGMEQNKNALLTCSTKGLETLDTIKSYKGDQSLLSTCKSCLNFYKTEAATEVQDVINYQVSKENFEKLKKAFDAKTGSSRTKADVDEYNKAVADLNKMVAKSNSTNEDLNKKRSTAIDNWNKTVAVFLDKQVPKYK